jgi:hypothetical protein
MSSDDDASFGGALDLDDDASPEFVLPPGAAPPARAAAPGKKARSRGPKPMVGPDGHVDFYDRESVQLNLTTPTPVPELLPFWDVDLRPSLK